jgi:hypothetical protein
MFPFLNRNPMLEPIRNAVTYRIAPRHKRRPAWRAYRVSGIPIAKHHALCGQTVNVRRFVIFIPLVTDIRPALVVRKNYYDIRFGLLSIHCARDAQCHHQHCYQDVFHHFRPNSFGLSSVDLELFSLVPQKARPSLATSEKWLCLAKIHPRRNP